ncbi:MAG: hypothetical protein EOP56_13105 [Sphingobacteriales bacterium]|nr:MAG: hypothetical protein EOP56_13105 [Sphingobacteriales bacterium]
MRLAEFAYQHQLTVLYEPSQLKEFVRNCEDLHKEFRTSKASLLDRALQNAKGSRVNSHVFKMHFAGANTTLEHITDNAFSAIEPPHRTAIISQTISSGTKTVYVAIAPDDLKRHSVEVVGSLDNILAWVAMAGGARNFNLSAKHGENGVGHWPTASRFFVIEQRHRDF